MLDYLNKTFFSTTSKKKKSNEEETHNDLVAKSVNEPVTTSPPVAVGAPTAEPTPPTPIESNHISPKARFNERCRRFEDEISKDILNIHEIRSLAFEGIPEGPGLRSLYWKVLLNYLPLKLSGWNEELKKRRALYNDWCKELVTDPREKYEREGAEDKIEDVTHVDHPLNQAQDSQWQTYFKDKETLTEIEKDVRRTFPHLHFFNSDTETGDTKHCEAVKRILYIYAKLNPGIHYVQGMNEVLGPVYYTFATDPRKDFRESAEADAFFCFTNLMSEIMNNFCKTLDKSQYGVLEQIAQMDAILKEKDSQLWYCMHEKNVDPAFYSFRWITCLLSQDFELPDILRCWDSLFADPRRFEFLLYVCCAMIVIVRDELFMGNFAENLKLLQNYPTKDMTLILAMARELRENPSFTMPVWLPPEPKADSTTPPSGNVYEL